MDPLTLVLAALGVAAGFGANTVITKKRLGSAQDQADKELAKAKREAAKRLTKEIGQRGNTSVGLVVN